MFIPPRMQPHIKKIFAGEYDVPLQADGPTIVDIGANIGGFARWAYARWTNSRIHCFEPIKENYEMLTRNVADLQNVYIYNSAIGSSDREQQMYYGKNNEGEASMYQGVQQLETGEVVKVKSAAMLPNCTILKIDTEGAEIEILENIKITPTVIMVEYHSEQNRRRIEELLRDNYTMIGSNSETNNYGIVKYALTNLIK